MTPDINKILFSNIESKNLNKFSDILFNVSSKKNIDDIPVDVSYFSLKKEKILNDGNVINLDEPLMAVGFCEETNKINVCVFENNIKIYFWVNFDEVEFRSNVVENWNLDKIKSHYKALNEKWIIEKNTIKESKKKKYKDK